MRATTTTTWWHELARRLDRALARELAHRIARRRAERRRARRAARELAGLSPRELRDIGIERDGPERAARLGRRD